MADVNTGIGPFLAIYLTATRHWNPASVGIVVSAQSIASVIAQGPAGWLVDWSQHKKHLIIGAAAAVALGCFGIVWARAEPSEILSCLWIFMVSVVLFHFANAAMLPLVGELLSKGNDGKSSFYMSACIIAAQFVMIPIAFLTGKLADPWGRKPLFLIGFAVLTLRGILYTLGKGAFYLLAVQSLDGVGAAISGVLWVIIISDLAKGTGRFNLLQGLIQAALGIGAFLSNFLAGFVVKRQASSILECEIKRSVRHWISIGRRPMPTILKRSTVSIMRTRCWNTRSQASEPGIEATYRTNALVSRAKSGLLSGESLAAVIFGSRNSS